MVPRMGASPTGSLHISRESQECIRAKRMPRGVTGKCIAKQTKKRVTVGSRSDADGNKQPAGEQL